ncbi:MAG: TonB-dependent receptor [Gammaproteobacteria bacterium]|nr:TonB-dependent receptor [Gammaproteobacteria bacterium]
MKMKSVFRQLSVLLIISHVPSYAQVTELEAVTVTATRTEKSVDEIPAGVSTVSQDAVQLGTEQLGLDESLNRVPGVFFLNRYNFAQDLRASIRGFGARSNFGIRGIKIIVDGIPETLPDGQGSVDGIDIGSAGRINVIRGPTSSLYGNASGGAIIVESEDGPTEPFAESRLTSGDFGFDRVQVKTGGETGNFNYLLNLSDTSIDGFRDHSEAENTQLNAKFSIDIPGPSSLQATVHYTDQPTANDPGGITAEDAEENRKQAQDRNVLFDAGETLEQSRVGLVYKRAIGNDDELELRLYSTQRDFSNRLPFEDAGAVQIDRQFNGGGAKYSLNGDLAGMDNRLLVGFDYDRQDDDRTRRDNLEGVLGDLVFDQRELVTSLGVFIQNETSIGRDTLLTLGSRNDNIEFDVTDRFLFNGDDSGIVEFDEFSPMVGVSHEFRPGSWFYGTVSTAFETPTTTEFANPSGGGFNQTLSPQESTNYELGIKSRVGDHRIEAAIFHITVDDELIPFEVADQPGRSFFENAGSSTRDGLEFSYVAAIGNGIELTASYTYSDFKFDNFVSDDGDIFNGNSIPGIPRDQAFVEFSWFGESGLYARWDVAYFGRFFADNANEEEVDSYVVSNLRIGYNSFIGDWELAPFLGINNLFDEEYNSSVRINAFGGRYFEPAPDRNVFFGVTIRKNFSS